MERLIKAARGVRLHSRIEVEPDENGSHLATGFVRVPLEDLIELCEAIDAAQRDLGPGERLIDGEVMYSAAYL